jgi:hypothetical protein
MNIKIAPQIIFLLFVIFMGCTSVRPAELVRLAKLGYRILRRRAIKTDGECGEVLRQIGLKLERHEQAYTVSYYCTIIILYLTFSGRFSHHIRCYQGKLESALGNCKEHNHSHLSWY